MAIVRAFRGVLYDPKKVGGDLSKVVAPPYDVINEDERRELHERHPKNFVRLILGEDKPSDGESENRYTRAGGYLRDWLADGTFVRDAAPALYFYRQSYRFPWENHDRDRDGVLAGVRLEALDAGVVLPHERTLDAPKADRLLLTQATGANLSPVFGLFSDADGTILGAIRALTSTAPRLDGVDPAGVRHRLWSIADPVLIAAFSKGLAEKQIFIADGHHRYSTALAFRDLMRKQYPDAGERASFEHVLMYLMAIEDPGLVILPIHRVLYGLPGFEAGSFLSRVKERLPVVREVADAAAARAALDGEPAGSRRVALVVRGIPGAVVLDLAGQPGRGQAPAHIPPVLWDLDLRRIHHWIVEEVAGIDMAAQARKEHLHFLTDAAEAEKEVLSGAGDVAILVRPTRIQQVTAVALAKEVMPQKSTFFYPKLASGMVIAPIVPPETLG